MEVVFVLYNTSAGSTMVKGIQPAEHFGINWVESKNLAYNTIRDHILVFVGSMTDTFKLTPERIEDLQSRNNFVIQEPVDNYCYHHPWEGGNPMENACLSVVDGIFTPNTFALHNLRNVVKDDCILINLPHNLDKHFFDVPQEKNKDFTIGYGGNVYANEYFDKPPVPYLEFNGTGHNDDVLKFCKRHTCHFSHRMSNTLDFHMKPASKVVVASVCGSPIVTSKDCSVMDLLPHDYPLLVGDDREDVVRGIEYAKSIFGTPEWENLLDIANGVVKRTSLDYQKRDYYTMFKHYNWSRDV